MYIYIYIYIYIYSIWIKCLTSVLKHLLKIYAYTIKVERKDNESVLWIRRIENFIKNVRFRI